MDLFKIKQKCYDLMSNRKFYIEREPGSAFFHGERVAKIVINLRKKIIPDNSSYDDILTVSAWFHDIAKGIEPHENYGSIIAKQSLAYLCQEEELIKIFELIQFHCRRKPLNNSYSEWIKILQDADILDHFGSITIWTDFHYYSFEQKSVEEAIRHHEAEWQKICNKYTPLINYDLCKQMLLEKMEFVEEFYKRLKYEGIMTQL